MLLNGSPDLAFLHSSWIDDQPGSVGDDFLEVGDGWRIGEEGDGGESVLEMGEDIGNGVLVYYLNEVDVLMNAVVETANVDEVGGVGSTAVQLGDLACA